MELIKGRKYKWNEIHQHVKGVIYQGSHQFGEKIVYGFKDVIGDEYFQLYDIKSVEKYVGEEIIEIKKCK